MTQEEIQSIINERDMLRKKLDAEKDYREYVQENRIKGYVSGYMSRMDINAVLDHQLAERAEKTVMVLNKMANNPVLSEEAHKALDESINMIRAFQYYREQYFELLRTNDHLKHLHYMKKIKMAAKGM